MRVCVCICPIDVTAIARDAVTEERIEEAHQIVDDGMSELREVECERLPEIGELSGQYAYSTQYLVNLVIPAWGALMPKAVVHKLTVWGWTAIEHARSREIRRIVGDVPATITLYAEDGTAIVTTTFEHGGPFRFEADRDWPSVTHFTVTRGMSTMRGEVSSNAIACSGDSFNLTINES